MFCAALLLSCPCVEISIYSTCKRISQKILRNVLKFAMMIADQDMATINCAILRENMEEIYLRGPLGSTDVRIINSYPSKVDRSNARAKVARAKVALARKSRAPKPLARMLETLRRRTLAAQGRPSFVYAMGRPHVLQLLCCRQQLEA